MADSIRKAIQSVLEDAGYVSGNHYFLPMVNQANMQLFMLRVTHTKNFILIQKAIESKFKKRINIVPKESFLKLNTMQEYLERMEEKISALENEDVEPVVKNEPLVIEKILPDIVEEVILPPPDESIRSIQPILKKPTIEIVDEVVAEPPVEKKKKLVLIKPTSDEFLFSIRKDIKTSGNSYNMVILANVYNKVVSSFHNETELDGRIHFRIEFLSPKFTFIPVHREKGLSCEKIIEMAKTHLDNAFGENAASPNFYITYTVFNDYIILNVKKEYDRLYLLLYGTMQ